MNITKTIWPPDYMEEAAKVDPTIQFTDDDVDQPQFAFTLGWNRPHAKLYQPYLVIHCWRWKIQAGWLYW